MGFTHYWTKSKRGNNVIKRRTRLKSKTRIQKELYEMIKSNRHLKLYDQFIAIKRKLTGYYELTNNSRILPKLVGNFVVNGVDTDSLVQYIMKKEKANTFSL